MTAVAMAPEEVSAVSIVDWRAVLALSFPSLTRVWKQVILGHIQPIVLDNCQSRLATGGREDFPPQKIEALPFLAPSRWRVLLLGPL